MKKLISLALAIVLAFALAIPAFAADIEAGANVDVFNDPTVNNNSTTITYTMDGFYTVDIPANFSLTKGGDGKITGSATLKVETAMLGFKQQLDISIRYDGLLELGTTGQTLEYTIKNGETTISKNTAALLHTVTADATYGFSTFNGQTVTLDVKVDDPVQYAGTYTDTITFTTAVNPVPQQG